MITTVINREPIPTNRRGSHIDALFGLYFPMQFEPTVFAIASELSPDYHGGYWEFYELGNRGFYMAPDLDAPLVVRCENGYEGRLSPDALGITACLYAYSRLSFTSSDAIARIYAKQYHLLREYMMDHAEAGAILGATD